MLINHIVIGRRQCFFINRFMFLDLKVWQKVSRIGLNYKKTKARVTTCCNRQKGQQIHILITFALQVTCCYWFLPTASLRMFVLVIWTFTLSIYFIPLVLLIFYALLFLISSFLIMLYLLIVDYFHSLIQGWPGRCCEKLILSLCMMKVEPEIMENN